MQRISIFKLNEKKATTWMMRKNHNNQDCNIREGKKINMSIAVNKENLHLQPRVSSTPELKVFEHVEDQLKHSGNSRNLV